MMFFSAFNLMSFFGLAQQDKDNTMTIEQLKQQMKNDSTIMILDVRTSAELIGPLGKLDKVINIPIQVLEQRLGELEKFKDKEIAVICRSGNRSNTVKGLIFHPQYYVPAYVFEEDDSYVRCDICTIVT